MYVEQGEGWGSKIVKFHAIIFGFSHFLCLIKDLKILYKIQGK